MFIPGDPQCIFDFQSTGDKQIAMDTATVNMNMEQDSVILGE